MVTSTHETSHRRVDTVLKVEPSDGDGFLIAIESQTSRSRDTGSSWSYYVAYLYAKFRLPVLLVAVCRNRATAAWAAGPFESRVGSWTTQVTRPFVLGPDNVPEITDESVVAREPALAAFSAIVHSESEKAPAILEMVARGMRSFDKATAKYWCEWLEVGLENTPVRDTWRGLEKMVGTYFPGRGTLFEESYLEGKAAGRAEGRAEDRVTMILRVLEKRGVGIPQATRDRISSCTDLDTLTLWFDRSLTAATAEDLFVEK
ncbi:hypothetical protein [Streptomyces indiaensis]|uniref:DUF4351 domain-containing protein n=1 Tax=Streptomyces indiaensis TaxID=284033 RepID=A0ABP5QQ72_9ACTN|nr:hypothetical protein [Streptomyces indiaensis]MCF1649388.1 hypothetical protein [Streptomyces indiaensis]